MIECTGGLLGLPVFLCYGNRMGKVDSGAVFFGRSASWHRLVIPIYFMYGNRMTMGNRNEDLRKKCYIYTRVSTSDVLFAAVE